MEWKRLAVLILICVSSLIFIVCIFVPREATVSKEASEIQLPMKAWSDAKLTEWAKADLFSDFNATDFKTFSYRLRKFKELFTFYEQSVPVNSKDHEYEGLGMLDDLEALLFPWLKHFYSTSLQLKRSFNGRGIVIATGSHHFKMAVFLIRTIREMGSELPICIAHAGEQDLKVKELFYLYSLQVTQLDISQYIDTAQLHLKGWQIKPFAVLFAPFKEVILMDADVVFLQKPDLLFEDEGYKENHSIFFRDRTLFDKDWQKTVWLDTNLPTPLSEQVKQTRMYRQISGHELESGVVVMNKEHRLFSLLAACKLNCPLERDQSTYKIFYGDKETYWVGTEMVGESYAVLWERAGVIGQAKNLQKAREEREAIEAKEQNRKRNKLKRTKESDSAVVCGRIAHFDRQGKPLWFNGGIVENKHDEQARNYLTQFTHYAHEGVWEFAISCILNSTAIETSQEMQNRLKQFGNLWRPKISTIEIFDEQ